MKEPHYLYQLNTTASLADIIIKTNEIIDEINFMWNPEETGSLDDR
jgi:hypothetical protein